LNRTFQENLTKSKPYFLGKLGQALEIDLNFTIKISQLGSTIKFMFTLGTIT
jgi:hypothetical protein